MEDFCQKFLICCLGSLFSHSENLFFFVKCFFRHLHEQRITYSAVQDYLMRFSGYFPLLQHCSSKQPVPPIQPAPLASCPASPQHRLKYPCLSSNGTVTMCIAACFSFPAPLHPHTLQCASCPSYVKASFYLLSSARATKPVLSPKAAGCPVYHAQCRKQWEEGEAFLGPGWVLLARMVELEGRGDRTNPHWRSQISGCELSQEQGKELRSVGHFTNWSKLCLCLAHRCKPKKLAFLSSHLRNTTAFTLFLPNPGKVLPFFSSFFFFLIMPP